MVNNESIAIPTSKDQQPLSKDDEKKVKIAAAVAKAKARKLANKVVGPPVKSSDESSIEPSVRQTNTSIKKVESTKSADDKKSRVAAAVAKAKAKAKKLTAQQEKSEST